MPIVLNKDTREYFVSDNEQEQHTYLKKLLNHNKPITLSLDLKSVCTHTVFKSAIRWNRTDQIIIVPSSIETSVLNNKNYQHISINYSGNVLF